MELIRKVTLSLAVTIGVILVVVLIVREVWKDGIIIEPVIVQLPEVKGAPTSELASQQIAKHIDHSDFLDGTKIISRSKLTFAGRTPKKNRHSQCQKT